MESDQKRAIKAELEAARQEFHAVAASFSPRDWNRQSLNPGWTNREILFHMTLGFLLLPVLVTMVGLWAYLPTRYGKAFANMLNWSTPAFNVVNGIGPRLASRVFYGPRLERLYDRRHRAILRKLARVEEHRLQTRMPYPSRWDPLFEDYMTIEKLFAYPIRHFRFHLGQLAR
ncbi:MAG TPA: DinB family protein [Gemmatimonadales bacterium]|nr:DinB family protein [Gemmatimonadales bacterium]